MEHAPFIPDSSQLNALSEALRVKLGLDLFGVDVIIECDTRRYAVIDINVFPSMSSVLFKYLSLHELDFWPPFVQHPLFSIKCFKSFFSETTRPKAFLFGNNSWSSFPFNLTNCVGYTKNLNTFVFRLWRGWQLLWWLTRSFVVLIQPSAGQTFHNQAADEAWKPVHSEADWAHSFPGFHLRRCGEQTLENCGPVGSA